MKRRRFLAVAAGFAAFPAFAASPLRWEGIALGAQARLELVAPEEVARPALAEARATLEAVEEVFSLYRPDSLVSRLNRDGSTKDAPDLYLTLHRMVDDLHRLTGGLFDPTVQARWSALAQNKSRHEVALEGWDHVQADPTFGIRLGHGQQVTFNGVAQGYATDLVVAVLRAHGLTDAFVDLGEQVALGPSRRLGLVDPTHGRVGDVTLTGGAMATSSPAATPLADHGHILRPGRPERAPLWSTVTVEADSAALADGLSTALVHADLPRIRRLRQYAKGVRRIITVDWDGTLRTL